MSADTLNKQLELARRDLLELTTQNRLLNTPREQTTGCSLEIKDEVIEQVFLHLVTEEKPMRFEQGELVEVSPLEADPETAEGGDVSTADAPAAKKTTTKKRVTTKRAAARKTKATTAETEADAPSTSASKPRAIPSQADDPDRQSDDTLHTELDADELDRRLLGLYTDATASFDEQGVNILYLVLGFLRWYEPGKPDEPRDAPLLLIPVHLDRAHAGNRFSLVYSGDEIETNLTLKTRLKIDYGIDLPIVPPVEDLSPAVYFKSVEQAIAGQRGWEVRANDCVLWFFSFTKLLMYRDLAPETWPVGLKLEDQPLIRGLLGTGFPSAPPLCPAEASIDPLLAPLNTMHVIDCDSSQSLVIEEVCRGRSLVIQGPPGTGKSQTITNLIAAAVKSGKTILFIAEKMAALEVVKRRMDNIGLGDMCLELHSHAANKRAVLQEVDRTLKLGRPKEPPGLKTVVGKLKELRDKLNRHADVMHTAIAPHGRTPYQILTELIDLRCAQVPLPDFQIADAPQWTAPQLDERTRQVRDYCDAIAVLGPPQEHPWRGCQLQQVLPLDLERLLVSIPQAVTALDELRQTAETLGQKFGGNSPTTIDGVARLARTVRAVVTAPKLDPQPLAGLTWDDHRKAIHEIAEAGRAILKAKEQLKGVVKDSAWETDASSAVEAYRQRGKSMFRMLFSSYRAARRTLKAALTGPQPATYEERLSILELLDGYQRGQKQAVEADSLGAKAFGRLWAGKQTDWSQISHWEQWDRNTAGLDPLPKFRGLCGLVDDPAAITKQLERVEQLLKEFIDKFSGLLETLKFDRAAAFGPAPKDAKVPDSLQKIAPAHLTLLTDLRARLETWRTQPERLQHWGKYVGSQGGVQSIAAGALVQRINGGQIAAADGPTAFRFAVHESLLRDALTKLPELATFDGAKFQQLIEEFRAADLQRLMLARSEVADSHYAGMGRPRGAGMAEAVALLKHEMQKKRRHLPLRQLLSRAGQAIQAVKPVFMMSPLSVAQFLEPGALKFDMLLIDEASQVRPVEALGAAARCQQMVCVGDDKQMPPTQFFGIVVGDVVIDEDAPEMQAGDVESVLSLCIARNMPQRMLRWHYRSKHHSLIAVSNREFYDDQLYVIPSPERQGDLGVKWHFIETGRFANGKNPIEAEIVAQAIMEHARKFPKWTLGVGAFSVSQRDEILKCLEKLRRDDRSTDAFFDPNAPDPFFIKNLENIQGDERDVIFVSVGYGPGENGKVALNFGPVSSAGGERRLNVLMTRAKRKCELFSSMRPEDLDLTRATGKGPAAFRAYLEFAQNGGLAKANVSSRTEDRLLAVLQRELESRGYKVATNVGIAGVFVDLAVVDPDNPDRYLVGVELDGVSYREARSARDRDRVRPSVLTAQGWSLHRLWSMDWFQRPNEQLNKVVAAVEAARKPQKSSGAGGGADTFTLERHPSSGDPLAAAVGSAVPVEPMSAGKAAEAESSDNTAAILGSLVKVVGAGLTGGKDAAIDVVLKEVGLKEEQAGKKK